MGEAGQHHSKLVSGLWIASGRIQHGQPRKIARGTLTGIALDLSSRRKVLVTNHHVMAGTYSNGDFKTDPDGREQMYHSDIPGGTLVGVRPEYHPMGGTNHIDLALLDLADQSIEVDHVLHDHPDHTSRRIVAGTVAPSEGQSLIMMGASGGERQVTVSEVGRNLTIAGQRFVNLVKLDLSRRWARDGDSGAGCYELGDDGNYRMVCIFFADLGGSVGWAFPASSAETLKGIRFGNTPPTVRAGSPQTVTEGDTVTLDGSGNDPDYDDLTYRWEPSAGVGGAGISLSGATSLRTTFTAPAGPTALSFRLTVTDEFGASATDTVNVTVEAKPVEVWGEWTDTGETSGDGMTREKEQRRTSTFGHTETRWVRDPAPYEPPPPEPDPDPEPDVEDWGPWVDTSDTTGSLGDRMRKQERWSMLGNTQTRWVSDPEPVTWGSWRRTGRTQGSGGAREAEESRLSNYGVHETRWVPDPEDDEDWGPWTDTGRTRVLPSLIEWEKEQERTSNLGNRETKWVYSHMGP